MKKYLLIYIIVFSSSSPANVLVAGRSDSLNSPELKNICEQMTTDHLSDIQQVNDLYQELKTLTGQNNSADYSEKINFLVSQIKEYSRRIQYLSKPEWNNESISVELTWEVPNALFFDDAEYLKLKQEIRNTTSQAEGRTFLTKLYTPASLRPLLFATDQRRVFHPDLNRYLTFQQNSILNKKIGATFFLNSENAEIKDYLFLKADFPVRTEYERDRGFVIVYKKNVTALEACQFLNTLFFEVEIGYVEHLLDLKFEKQKKIFLIYKNEVENAR